MKPSAVAIFAVVLVVMAAIALTQDNHQVFAGNEAMALPASLDKFYPPHSPAPVYLLEMLALSAPLSGIACDVQENDLANAQKNFEMFRKQYVKLAAMIPEWTSAYPMPPLEELGKALETGDPGKVMGAMQEVGKSCHGCHQAYMPKAQHRYHWPEFGAIAVTDPLSGQDVNFSQLMMMLESNMTGVINDLQQGQAENALKQFGGFRARFAALEKTCEGCHTTERRYYTSDDITGTFDDIEKVLVQKTIDDARAIELLKKVGQESCHKCHLVHIPAAYAKETSTAM